MDDPKHRLRWWSRRPQERTDPATDDDLPPWEALTRPVRPLTNPRWVRLGGAALGIGLVLLAIAHFGLNLGPVKALVREKARAKLEQRLGPVALGDEVQISWSGRVQLGPLAIPAGPGEPPLVSVETLSVRASWLGLLRGAVEPSGVALTGLTVRLDEKGQRLRDFEKRRPGRAPGPSGAPAREGNLPPLEVEDARLVVDRADPSKPPLEVGPVDLQLLAGRERGGRSIDLRLQAGRGRARVYGTWQGAQGTTLIATADDLPLAQLAPGGAGVPVEIRSGLVSGKVELTAPPGMDEVNAQVDADVRELVAYGPRLAAEAVGPMQAYFSGQVKLDRTQGQVTTEEARLFLGPERVEIPFEATVELRPELVFDVDARVGPVNLQTLIGALPPQLAPPHGESREQELGQPGRLLMAPPQVDGVLRAEVRAAGPAKRPEAWSVGVRLDTAGLKEKARASPFALRDAFSYSPRDASGAERTFEVGGRNPNFVPLVELPAILPAAVITSEDGNFFSHNGFDFEEIRDSIATAAEGARLRGGSTLTQQLVKNLYLSRERTLARKLREALITLEIEAALPKQRILEIYLNLIEWGPGVYGIGEAARYYFGVDARRLTAKQAVFLATIIPNPVKYSVYFRKGATTRNWDEHMAHLIEKLRQRGDLNDEQYQRALAEPVAFRAAH
jgi:hypothetical protein